VYLDTFKEFEDEETGGLNRFARITNWHLPILQQIRSYARTQGMKKLQRKLAHEPQYFEGIGYED
jgi:hypothetical protein